MLEGDGVKVSLNDLAASRPRRTLKRVPNANASYTPDGIAFHHHADIAVAVAIEEGSSRPSSAPPSPKGVAQIASRNERSCRTGPRAQLKPEEFQGGTFSISNLGMFAVRSFASIINEPQGAILSVGAGEKRAVVRGEQIVVATVMTVTLTCDHRVVDRAIGARWLQAFQGDDRRPITMIV